MVENNASNSNGPNVSRTVSKSDFLMNKLKSYAKYEQKFVHLLQREPNPSICDICETIIFEMATFSFDLKSGKTYNIKCVCRSCLDKSGVVVSNTDEALGGLKSCEVMPADGSCLGKCLNCSAKDKVRNFWYAVKGKLLKVTLCDSCAEALIKKEEVAKKKRGTKIFSNA